MSTNCAIAGRVASPSMSLQSGISKNPITDDKNYPAVRTTILAPTALPLIYTGLNSERYRGTVWSAIPTPTPTTSLPLITT